MGDKKSFPQIVASQKKMIAEIKVHLKVASKEMRLHSKRTAYLEYPYIEKSELDLILNKLDKVAKSCVQMRNSITLILDSNKVVCYGTCYSMLSHVETIMRGTIECVKIYNEIKSTIDCSDCSDDLKWNVMRACGIQQKSAQPLSLLESFNARLDREIR